MVTLEDRVRTFLIGYLQIDVINKLSSEDNLLEFADWDSKHQDEGFLAFLLGFVEEFEVLDPRWEFCFKSGLPGVLHRTYVFLWRWPMGYPARVIFELNISKITLAHLLKMAETKKWDPSLEDN